MSSGVGLKFFVARSLDEVLRAWRLVYSRYTSEGILESNPHAIHTNPCAVQPDAWVIVGSIRGETVTTLTIMHDSERGLPLDAVYPEELVRLRGENRPILEVGLLADRREKLERYITALYSLYSFAWFNAKYTDHVLVCGVHPHHANFYIGSFGFERYGAATCYANMNNAPVVLLKMDIQKTLEMSPLPKATKSYLKHPLPPEVFDDRFRFSDTEIAGTALDSYLRDHWKGD